MSKINVKTFFRLCKVKVVGQAMDTTKNLVKIKARPDRRYFPVCYRCGNKVKKIHSYKQRTVRDLDILGAKTFVRVLLPLR